eukprot:1122870-Prymnesium_polylepis.1
MSEVRRVGRCVRCPAILLAVFSGRKSGVPARAGEPRPAGRAPLRAVRCACGRAYELVSCVRDRAPIARPRPSGPWAPHSRTVHSTESQPGLFVGVPVGGPVPSEHLLMCRAVLCSVFEMIDRGVLSPSPSILLSQVMPFLEGDYKVDKIIWGGGSKAAPTRCVRWQGYALVKLYAI